LPLSEKVRVEIFIPELPDPAYVSLLEQLGDEVSYSFGGCTVISTAGKYRSTSGAILPDRINILFSDIPCQWNKDRLLITQYVDRLKSAVQSALKSEEAVQRSMYSVCHVE
jgi:hypothetical protein